MLSIKRDADGNKDLYLQQYLRQIYYMSFRSLSEKTFFSNDRVFLFKILKEGKQYSVKTIQQ